MKTIKTITCYDTETNNLFNKGVQITQWASIQADLNTSISLGENPLTNLRNQTEAFIKPENLTYFSPAAVLTTGVAPSELRSNPDAIPFSKGMDLVNKCLRESDYSGAYNGASFDKNVVRQNNFRQLKEPYHPATQTDFFLFIKHAYAMQAKDINWPGNFKLEDIANKNGITFQAHDALEDVRTMINVVNMIASRNPEIWNSFMLNHELENRKETLTPGAVYLKTSTAQRSFRSTSVQICTAEDQFNKGQATTLDIDKIEMLGLNSFTSLMIAENKDLIKLNTKPAKERPGNTNYKHLDIGKAKVGLKKIPTGTEKANDCDKSVIEKLNFSVADNGAIVFDDRAIELLTKTGHNIESTALKIEAYNLLNSEITRDNSEKVSSRLFEIFTSHVELVANLNDAKPKHKVEEIEDTISAVIQFNTEHNNPISTRANLTAIKDDYEKNELDFFYTNGLKPENAISLNEYVTSGDIHNIENDWFTDIPKLIDGNLESTLLAMAAIDGEYHLSKFGHVKNMVPERVILLDKAASQILTNEIGNTHEQLEKIHTENLLDLEKRKGAIGDMDELSRKAVIECCRDKDRLCSVFNEIHSLATLYERQLDIDKLFEKGNEIIHAKYSTKAEHVIENIQEKRNAKNFNGEVEAIIENDNRESTLPTIEEDKRNSVTLASYVNDKVSNNINESPRFIASMYLAASTDVVAEHRNSNRRPSDRLSAVFSKNSKSNFNIKTIINVEVDRAANNRHDHAAILELATIIQSSAQQTSNKKNSDGTIPFVCVSNNVSLPSDINKNQAAMQSLQKRERHNAINELTTAMKVADNYLINKVLELADPEKQQKINSISAEMYPISIIARKDIGTLTNIYKEELSKQLNKELDKDISISI